LITNGKVSDILKVPVSRLVENLIDSSWITTGGGVTGSSVFVQLITNNIPKTKITFFIQLILVCFWG
jgi:hypothetical protein